MGFSYKTDLEIFSFFFLLFNYLVMFLFSFFFVCGKGEVGGGGDSRVFKGENLRLRDVEVDFKRENLRLVTKDN